MSEFRAGSKREKAHGYSRYTAGCRCEKCKSAKAAYMRERRAEAREAAASGGRVVGQFTHGTRFGYDERGCRCAPCAEAKRASYHPETRPSAPSPIRRSVRAALLAEVTSPEIAEESA